MPGELADETVLVHLYVDERHKAAWKEAAPRHGYTSMSKYLYDLILEARSYRDQGFLAHHDSEARIADLEAQIQDLEDQLDQERVKQSGRVSIDDPAFVQQFLTDQYQPLARIMQRVLESGALDDLVRKRIEDQLYFLASQDRVTYESGHGWKLVDGTEA